MTKMESNDPRLTAYALGELEGAERPEVEAAIAGNAALRSEINEVRATAAALERELSVELKRELANETASSLLGDQRAKVLTRGAPWHVRLFGYRKLLIPAAAVGAVAIGTTYQLRREDAQESVNGGAGRADMPALSAEGENPKEKSTALRAADSSAQPRTYVGKTIIRDAMLRETAPPLAPAKGKDVVRDGLVSHDAFAYGGPIGPGRFNPHFNTEGYEQLDENPFLEVAKNPLSTFSSDVDTASYSNLRRFLITQTKPPKDAVRIEELVNYFPYEYPSPTAADPFSVNVEIGPAPWAEQHRLVRIGLKGREVAMDKRPAANLVFLLDVSGSMDEPNKLPLVKQSIKTLAEKLGPRDRVSIVVYAGASGLALAPTPGNQSAAIVGALENLRAGGSTNGGEAIELAYKVAAANFIKGGLNRVILATDGDFNVGVSDQGSLIRMIAQKAKSGVFLTVLGFGMGNIKDSTLEKLADKGNGHYAYIDSASEARKVLVEEAGGTLMTIAKDVKIQVEFNPTQAAAFRLVGYENRILRHEDFNDDKKDAGEIGAGHTVTALYEVVPHGVKLHVPGIDPLKYQRVAAATAAAKSGELLTLKLRYKDPDRDVSKLIERSVRDNGATELSADSKFAASVAAFGMILRESPSKGKATLDLALQLAEDGRGADKNGYRSEFISLIHKAKSLK